MRGFFEKIIVLFQRIFRGYYIQINVSGSESGYLYCTPSSYFLNDIFYKRNYINFVMRSGCYSELGSKKQGQEISLIKECLNFSKTSRQLLLYLKKRKHMKDIH